MSTVVSRLVIAGLLVSNPLPNTTPNELEKEIVEFANEVMDCVEPTRYCFVNNYRNGRMEECTDMYILPSNPNFAYGDHGAGDVLLMPNGVTDERDTINCGLATNMSTINSIVNNPSDAWNKYFIECIRDARKNLPSKCLENS